MILWSGLFTGGMAAGRITGLHLEGEATHSPSVWFPVCVGFSRDRPAQPQPYLQSQINLLEAKLATDLGWAVWSKATYEYNKPICYPVLNPLWFQLSLTLHGVSSNPKFRVNIAKICARKPASQNDWLCLGWGKIHRLHSAEEWM